MDETIDRLILDSSNMTGQLQNLIFGYKNFRLQKLQVSLFFHFIFISFTFTPYER